MKTSSPTHQEIAEQAYQIYVRSGCQHGRALDHWLEAEAALRRAESTTAKPAVPQASNDKSKAATARAAAAPAKAPARSKKPAKSAK